MMSSTLKNVDDVKSGHEGTASGKQLSSTVTSAFIATVSSDKTVMAMENTTDRETKFPATGNPGLVDRGNTDEIIPEISDEEGDLFDTQPESFTSNSKNDRITTNPLPNVKTSIRRVNLTPASSLQYNSTTPYLGMRMKS
jgi:hypothetical protein